MDGKRIQNYWSNEMQAMLDTYKQFQILIPAENRNGAALISTPAISRNSINGSVTLKLKRFATVTKLSFNIPICFKK